jgi:replicative DNA helicase
MPGTPRGFHLPPFVMAPEDLEEVALKVETTLQAGREESFWPIPTGFATLDEVTGGGLHGGDLTIVGGVQNIGKTALILQWANHLAGQGALAIVVCYEHSTRTLWERLICQNAFEQDGGVQVTMDLLREAYIEAIRERERASKADGGRRPHMLDEVLARVPSGVKAWARVSQRMHNIWLASGDGLNTDLEALSKYVELAVQHYKRTRIVLFVDYVQRVPVIDTSRAVQTEERIERVLAGLKGLAMRTSAEEAVLSVVAVGAADEEGLRMGRVHLENLWGNAIMQYEPDVGLMGNRDGRDADGTPVVRWGVEKNRRGPSNLEYRHRYHGAAYWFEPKGMPVMLEDSWQAERDELRERVRQL